MRAMGARGAGAWLLALAHISTVACGPVLGRGGADYSHPASIAAARASSFWNWADKGVVTPVNALGYCAAGYAFFPADSLASQAAIAGHPLVPLSHQELIDCDGTDHGCDGGYPHTAFAWMLNRTSTGGMGGLTTAENYPYTGQLGRCQRDKVAMVHTKLGNFTYMPNTTEELMTSWVYHNGPLVVALQAAVWQDGYTGGIVKGCYGNKQPDKVFMITGYNNAHTPPYWILKDDFGTAYGIEGYVWMEKGIDACGITKYTSAANPQKPVRKDALGV